MRRRGLSFNIPLYYALESGYFATQVARLVDAVLRVARSL
jgi:hypothetical protein